MSAAPSRGRLAAAFGCLLVAAAGASGGEVVLRDGSRLEVREAALRGAWVHVEVDPATRWAYPVEDVDLRASGLEVGPPGDPGERPGPRVMATGTTFGTAPRSTSLFMITDRDVGHVSDPVEVPVQPLPEAAEDPVVAVAEPTPTARSRASVQPSALLDVPYPPPADAAIAGAAGALRDLLVGMLSLMGAVATMVVGVAVRRRAAVPACPVPGRTAERPAIPRRRSARRPAPRPPLALGGWSERVDTALSAAASRCGVDDT